MIGSCDVEYFKLFMIQQKNLLRNKGSSRIEMLTHFESLDYEFPNKKIRESIYFLLSLHLKFVTF